jgi:hypothetical protein
VDVQKDVAVCVESLAYEGKKISALALKSELDEAKQMDIDIAFKLLNPVAFHQSVS